MKYKVGDKVRIKSLDWYNANKNIFGKVWTSDGHIPFEICMSVWCGKVMTISFVGGDYYTMVEDLIGYWTDEMIEGLAEEEVGLIDKFSSRWINEFNLPEGYIFKDENGNVINATKIVLEKKKKEYPKTYEECCKVLDYSGNYNMILTTDVDNKLFNALYRLKVCRDAYWKIAGEEMGLGKPWKPNWTSLDGYPAIYMYRYQITLSVVKDEHHCLVFPTTEMRDAFYENFKESIEQCKELL